VLHDVDERQGVPCLYGKPLPSGGGFLVWVWARVWGEVLKVSTMPRPGGAGYPAAAGKLFALQRQATGGSYGNAGGKDNSVSLSKSVISCLAKLQTLIQQCFQNIFALLDQC